MKSVSYVINIILAISKKIVENNLKETLYVLKKTNFGLDHYNQLQ